VLVAPGLYGNENAQGYFKTAFDSYIVQRSPQNRDADFSLTVPFVIAATSLEKGQERYFLFGSERTLDDALTPQAWLHVASDPRWAVIQNVQVSELRDAAFASGSPFPVFSAHRVPVHALNTEERLIDGGFAHNIPLEAAAALGAQKVLVISSSPLRTGAPSAPCRWLSLLSVGDLTCNLPKLLPYLWERSQVEDVLSTRNMFVATIYPTAPESGWPVLTDFRAAVVKNLIDAADRDQLALALFDGLRELQSRLRLLQAGDGRDQIVLALGELGRVDGEQRRTRRDDVARLGDESADTTGIRRIDRSSGGIVDGDLAVGRALVAERHLAHRGEPQARPLRFARLEGTVGSDIDSFRQCHRVAGPAFEQPEGGRDGSYHAAARDQQTISSGASQSRRGGRVDHKIARSTK